MKVFTVVNQKGGVGKTTTAISLAGSLSAMGHRVILIDLDPHASLTHYLGVDSEKLSHSIYDLCMAAHHPDTLEKLVPRVILSTKISGIDLLPAHMALATLDGAIAQQAGKGLMVRKIIAALSPIKDLKSASVQHENTAYDFVVIDCQPVLGVLMVNALLAANVILLPTQTEHLGLHGLHRMLSTIEQMKQSLLPNVFTLIVPTMFDRRVKACVEAFAKMRDKYKAMIWRGYIPIDTKFREASVKGLPICKVAPSAKGNFAYEKLTMELLKHG